VGEALPLGPNRHASAGKDCFLCYSRREKAAELFEHNIVMSENLIIPGDLISSPVPHLWSNSIDRAMSESRPVLVCPKLTRTVAAAV